MFYVVSLYCPPLEDIAVSLLSLRRIHDALGPARIIVGVDINASSPLWFSSDSDRRGQLVEDFLAELRWLVRNELGNPSTFSTINGQSNVDLTISSSSAWSLFTAWHVRPGWTSSDHRVIDITLGTFTPSPLVRLPRYNVRHADWDVFHQMFEDLYPNEPAPLLSQPATDSFAAALTANIGVCADASTPLKTRFPRSVPWWTPRLSQLKRHVYRLRRGFQRLRLPALRAPAYHRYRLARRDYTRAVKSAKHTSWRNFITNQGNQEPFGVAYRVLRQALSVDVVMSNLRLPHGTSISWEDSALGLLSTLIVDSVTPDQALCPDTTPDFVEDCSTRRWTHAEVLRALKKSPLHTSPGNDRIETQMLRQLSLSPTFLRTITTLFNSCLQHGCFPSVWKHGILITILKDLHKDPQDPHSYRPICLLPLLGKTLERLMCLRLHTIFLHPAFASRRQFGFRKGCSVEDAICLVRLMTDATPGPYVVAILFDITTAFD